jgi:hypothetical protein
VAKGGVSPFPLSEPVSPPTVSRKDEEDDVAGDAKRPTGSEWSSRFSVATAESAVKRTAGPWMVSLFGRSVQKLAV